MESDRDSASNSQRADSVSGESSGIKQPLSKRTRATSNAEPAEESPSGSSTASKRIRMTMACERCRLNDTVESLQERVRSIESNLTDIRSNTQIVVDEIRIKHEQDDERIANTPDDTQAVTSREAINTNNTHPQTHLNEHTMMRLPALNSNWKLSLTHSGLRIDTDILSMNDLYNILFSGVKRQTPPPEMALEATSPESSSSGSNSLLENTIVTKLQPLWKSKAKTFPLYSMWEPATMSEPKLADTTESFPPAMLDQLFDIHRECFLCLPMANFEEFKVKYLANEADPLLLNAIFAWTARHAAIYHGLFPGRDPNSVGERFFENARVILKDRFLKTSEETMQGLLTMYTYCIGKTGPRKSEYESEAYLYLGMAIRMCLDMRMHIEDPKQNRIQAEKRRRFFWLCFFLETLCSAHSDKPFSFPEEQTHVVESMECLPHETDETYFRVKFTKYRYKITQLYREIAVALDKKNPYFVTVTKLDKKLSEFFDQLPDYFQYRMGDIDKRQWKSKSFREQGCIKLNIEMNFQLCQLYSAFIESPGEQSSAIGLIAEQNCVRAANTIVELLECWSMLEQRWCHFTLENLMMATSIYSVVILKNTNAEIVNDAKKHLEKMALILSKSPVRQQKHIVNLLQQIHKTLQANSAIAIEAASSFDSPSVHDSPSNAEQTSDTPNANDRPQTVVNYPISSSSIERLEVGDYNVMPISASNIPYSQAPISSTSQLPLNLASRGAGGIQGSNPAFDLPTHLNATDLFQFTDFVYTPTLMDYDSMDEFRHQNQRMRAQPRRPSYPEYVDNRMGSYDLTTPDQYMGHSFVYYHNNEK
ncbi:hypothetical protein INT43_000507 [Umbelopsis isabellina]|uniref:Xylanolytic transcriptional activator regulatory domain-containing protein n=1 Tax=Mortierella isabellina TaxID=91625 RepID=A0A8H7ULX2_MORIS|nr:hypothetical protein INT43_000507 [Umbelopsis isabellina]